MKIGIVNHCPAMPDGMSHSQFQAAIDQLARNFQYLASKGYDEVVSDGSQGFAQMAFWAVDKAKRAGARLKNTLLVPFPEQDLRWLEDGCFGKKDYALMTARADEIRYVTSSRPTKGGNITYAVNQAALGCVSGADMALAIWPSGENCDVPPWDQCSGRSVSLRAMKASGDKLQVAGYKAGKDGIVTGDLAFV